MMINQPIVKLSNEALNIFCGQVFKSFIKDKQGWGHSNFQSENIS